MKLFDKYLNGISDIVNKDEVKRFSSFIGNENMPDYFEKGIVNESLELQKSNTNNKVLIEFDKDQLTTLFGENPNSFHMNIIGTHPDFSDIKHHEYSNYYCVTMFMDIKGSTRLNEKYSLLEIRKIKDTILTLSIHVASHFGGHIHRLQGDGVLIQFVRKGQKEQDAVINALNTASVLTHFVSNDLANIFNNNGVRPLGIRTGIDLGFKDDVIWSHYGVPNCSELTTTSLHTDLAAKLQSNASSNGILLGGNIKEILDIKPEFCQDVKNDKGEIDYYIYQGIKNYRKFNFDWVKYLNSFDFTKLNSEKNGVEIEIPRERIKCEISDENDLNNRIYYQNSNAIPKGSKIKYTLFENEHIYHKRDFEIIEWRAYNSGKEAKEAEQERHDFGGKSMNKVYCETSAAYKGHHYVECIIKRQHSENRKIKFPIFVE
jgi:hypothetical protein